MSICSFTMGSRSFFDIYLRFQLNIGIISWSSSCWLSNLEGKSSSHFSCAGLFLRSRNDGNISTWFRSWLERSASYWGFLNFRFFVFLGNLHCGFLFCSGFFYCFFLLSHLLCFPCSFWCWSLSNSFSWALIGIEASGSMGGQRALFTTSTGNWLQKANHGFIALWIKAAIVTGG